MLCSLFIIPTANEKTMDSPLFVQACRVGADSPGHQLQVAFPSWESDKRGLQEEACEVGTVVCKSLSYSFALVGDSKMAPFSCCHRKKPSILQQK